MICHPGYQYSITSLLISRLCDSFLDSLSNIFVVVYNYLPLKITTFHYYDILSPETKIREEHGTNQNNLFTIVERINVDDTTYLSYLALCLLVVATSSFWFL